MDYGGLVETVRRYLKGQGIDCAVTAGKPVNGKALAKTESEMQVRLPADLREFYRSIGDGLSIFWEAEPNDAHRPFGGLYVPTLASHAALYRGWREMALYSPEQAEKYGFPYTKDPALAKRTAARMWHWLPVIEEGNGDMICQDLSDRGGPVIFHKHDWLDGGSGDDGHLLAPNWGAFLAGWGSVCFQFPEGHYWPSCFRPGGGVDWGGEHFRSPYRVADLT
jgi:cell wall assembly regulator SMI1